MLVEGINLPGDLLHAQAMGDLVVFAGAGVSAPTPSSLPLFDGLASQVGVGTGLERVSDESPDHFLGRLKENGLHVHQAVAQILLDPRSKPHELHTLLTHLFPADTAVRIVTTNFDRHFSTVVQERFGASIETFYDPALPLGDDFAGLVYLHGAAAKEPDKCVLTDEDFGRAYLTRGWASRFLSAMFGRFAVLFVGYSHRDPIMNYLARGLSPGMRKPRYAFTTDDERLVDTWKFLGIQQLVYHLETEENPHAAVTRCVRAWSVELHRGLLEKAERIRAIADAQPPLEGEDADYIRHSLGSIQTARVFFTHAFRPEWISWMEKHGFLDRFFDSNYPFTEFEQEFGFWLLDRFFVDNAQDVLALIVRKGGRIHRDFGWRIWQRLMRRHRDQNVDRVFPLWIALLLSQSYEILAIEEWSMLLGECRLPQEAAIVMQLFTNITRPRLRLKEHWSLLDPQDRDLQKVDFELNLLHDPDVHVGSALSDLICPNLSTFGPLFELSVIANLAAADNLVRLANGTREGIDPFWLHRESIERRDPRALRTLLDQLIVAARHLLTRSASSSTGDTLARANTLVDSGVPILQRLAVYLIGQAKNPTADEKVLWLLRQDLIYRFKTDVFHFLELNFSKAADEIRKSLVEAVVAGPNSTLFPDADEQTLIYERFNLLVWLHQIAPTCAYTKNQLETIRQANPEFRPRKRPDLDVWSTGFEWRDISASFDIEEVTRQDLHQFVATRPITADEDHIDSERETYRRKIAVVSRERPQWGLQFLGELVSCDVQDADLWSSVPIGWREATLSSEHWSS